jgi:hypothetical protein
MPLVIDDLTRETERRLLARRLQPTTRLALLCLRFLRHLTGRQVLAAIDRWADLLRDACRQHGDEVVDAVCMYALAVSNVRPKPLAERISNILQRPEDMVMSTLQRIYKKGRAEGEIEGRARGKAEGRVEGKAEGRVEGKVEGCAETLLRLLGKRFGPLPATIIRRVRSATATELARWTDRVLDAASLAKVFGA